ncbi:BRD4-interacting chromatin-remodeling complex-associated protein-like [Monodelphis domestica]|uniref:BRD4-interacting chromatin-remodeling complex-associated protein-like n=1 Tax=Monodelphis domestica TaxID=13616 RepID=UPI00028BD258|nr:BRD4-interacting chromatin-remodeling complex-associated protein-like [Monodelphis domestica]XP_016288943.1 BRD4-interacting chromatin-remodeling complex-associated protein-like [Monodelphis domestica]
MGFFRRKVKKEKEPEVLKRIPGWPYTNKWYCVAKVLSQVSCPVQWDKEECPIDPDGVSQWIICRLRLKRRGATGGLLWLMLTVIEKLAVQLDGAQEKLQDIQNKNTRAAAHTFFEEALKAQITKIEALEAQLVPSLGPLLSMPTSPTSEAEPELQSAQKAPSPASHAFSHSPTWALSLAPTSVSFPPPFQGTSSSGSAPFSPPAASSAYSLDSFSSPSDPTLPGQIQPAPPPRVSSPHQQAPEPSLTSQPAPLQQALTPGATSPPPRDSQKLLTSLPTSSSASPQQATTRAATSPPPRDPQQLATPPPTSSSAPPQQAFTPATASLSQTSLQLPAPSTTSSSAPPQQAPSSSRAPQSSSLQPASPDSQGANGRKVKKKLTFRENDRNWERTFLGDNPRTPPFTQWEHKVWVTPKSPVTDLRGQQSALREFPSFSAYELASLTEKYQQKPGESLKAWILNVLDKGADSLLLDAKTLRSLGPLTNDMVYNAILRGAPLGLPCASLLHWCLKCWKQRWPFLEDYTETLPSPWMSLEAAVQRLREEAMMEWIYLGKAEGLEGPDEVILSNHNRAQLIHSAPLQWKSLITMLLSEHTGTIGEMIPILREHLSRSKKKNTVQCINEGRRPIQAQANCRATVQQKERNCYLGLSVEKEIDSIIEAQKAKMATWV